MGGGMERVWFAQASTGVEFFKKGWGLSHGKKGPTITHVPTKDRKIKYTKAAKTRRETESRLTGKSCAITEPCGKVGCATKYIKGKSGKSWRKKRAARREKAARSAKSKARKKLLDNASEDWPKGPKVQSTANRGKITAAEVQVK